MSNHHLNKKSLVAKAISVALLAAPLTGFAEESEPDVLGKRLEVVTVTAQKRVQNVLKVPVTVSTVSEGLIKETGATLLSDIDKFIPGFDFDSSEMTQSAVTMRGISSPVITVGGDPSTATFYDDVYLPRAAQSMLFSDMARVEVLKGPQGTLFGRNAAMGVVNMVPNAPSEDFESFVKTTLGSDDLRRFEGMINLPVADNVYFRANALTNSQDGYVDNVATPAWNQNSKHRQLGERSHTAARAALFWDISERSNFQISYEWEDLEQAPLMAIGVSEFAHNGGQTPMADIAANDVKDGVESRDMDAVTLKFNYQFNDHWSMKHVTGFRQWQTYNRKDEDGTADITRYFDTSNNEDSDILYTETQFNYVSDKVNLVTGFSYSKEKVSQITGLNVTTDTAARLVTGQLNGVIRGGIAQQVAQMIGGDSDAHAAAAFGEGVTFANAVDMVFADSGFPLDHMWNANEWANALNALGFGDDIMTAIGMAGVPLSGDIVTATGDLTYDIVAQQLGIAEIFGPSVSGQFWHEEITNKGDFTNWGVFADVDYSITDKWHILGGLRYSNDKKDFGWLIPVNDFAQTRPGVNNLLFQQVDMTASDEWDKITGRLVSNYLLTDDHMVFVSYSTGYKSGGFDSLTASQQSFAPEDTTNIEFGYKGIGWGKLVVNFSAYHLELDNFQVSIDSKAPGSPQAVPTIINENREITGTELDLRWLASDSLTVGLVSEVRSTDIHSPEFYNGEGTLIAADKSSIDGQVNYTLSLDWMPQFAFGTTNLHVDYVFVENTNHKQPGLEEYKNAVPAYFKDTKNLNARLSWSNDDDTLELGLWGKNLLDERYIRALGGLAAEELGTPHGYINRGIEFGIDMKYLF